MRGNAEKVVVAMSGGVDSSVAACLLVEQGFDVVGLFMRTGVTAPDRPTGKSIPPPVQGEVGRRHQGCCSAGDAADARFVAGMLGIPFYVLNFEKDFDRLIDYFADEYAAGRTPNPCVVCNDKLKFGRLVEYADAVGAKYIATGHYARIGTLTTAQHGKTAGAESRVATQRHVLLRGRDRKKDQSYVLFGLDRAVLDRVLFPIGALEKSAVRRLAERFNLPNRDKPDSVEICFVPDRDYARVVRTRRPDAFVEGDVVTETGKSLGTHRGIGHYTIGQRRGLGIAAGKPVYVTRIDVEANRVTLGGADALLHAALTADRVNFLVDPPGDSFRADVKIRYLHRGASATVTRIGGDKVRVVFDEPQRAVTPGQAVVFYEDEVVLGGAWIMHADVPAGAFVGPSDAAVRA